MFSTQLLYSIYPFSLIEKSRIDEYANIGVTAGQKMSHPSPKSPFSVFVHWRLQVSTSHLSQLHTGPRLASKVRCDVTNHPCK